MKKLLGCALALLMLTACGGSGGEEAKTETRTCTLTLQGMDISVNLTGTNNSTDKIVMDYSLPLSLMGVDTSQVDLSAITQEQLDQIGEAAMSAQGIEKGNGVEAVFKIEDDTLLMTLTIDVKNASDEALKALELAKDQKLSDMTESLEAAGATCH